MFSRILFHFKEPKTTIGWAHGIMAILGAFALAYGSGMSLSTLLQGDAAMRLLPSMLLTPVMACGFGFWLLFSKTLLHVSIKIVLMALFNACIIAFF
ncbi:hypothetical protein [Sulfurospirillum barnesii]|uniref:Uncharacterized protein n=1 Tax=Sulfurospirillum barnesii (strain ATCC 700032 / DSM 10660 / SES-3) TaxID=760154 RepID=I3XY73_SULBS|nr:hypothetical protein [Sulfurospirillum barnesii]AFL68897.1 hypothetical protein Sulba_1609 [Sulfurospirillum barnesii SES-3]